MSSIREPPRQFQNSKLGGRRYERGKKLGEGAYGRVYACRELPGHDKLFAVKVVDAKGLSETKKKNLGQAAENMRRVGPHPNVLKFEECFSDGDEWIYFVTELVLDAHMKKSVTLADYSNRGWLEEEHVRKIFRQVVAGVKHLHAANVVHRNLRLENVFVHGPPANVKVKIMGFQRSKHIVPDLTLATSPANQPQYDQYASPEVSDPHVQSLQSYDCRSDLWSLGILLFVMLSGRLLENTHSAESQAGIDADVHQLKHISGRARSVVLGLLRIQPEERLPLDTMDALLDRPWSGECLNSVRFSGWMPPAIRVVALALALVVALPFVADVSSSPLALAAVVAVFAMGRILPAGASQAIASHGDCAAGALGFTECISFNALRWNGLQTFAKLATASAYELAVFLLTSLTSQTFAEARFAKAFATRNVLISDGNRERLSIVKIASGSKRLEVIHEDFPLDVGDTMCLPGEISGVPVYDVMKKYREGREKMREMERNNCDTDVSEPCEKRHPAPSCADSVQDMPPSAGTKLHRRIKNQKLPPRSILY